MTIARAIAYGAAPMRTTLAVVLFASMLAACGGGGGGSGADARMIGDTATGECTAPSMFEDGSLMDGDATSGTDDMYGENVGFGVYLNDDTAADGLDITIWKDFAPFNGTFSAQTIPLTGPQLSPDDCGACIAIETDITDDDYADDYLPTGGTLTLTSVSGKFTGTLTNATFQHVDGESGAPAADGCTTMLGNFAFDLTITPASNSNLRSRKTRAGRLHHGSAAGQSPTRLHLSNVHRI